MLKYNDKNIKDIYHKDRSINQIYYKDKLVWFKSELIIIYKNGEILKLGRPIEIARDEFRYWPESKYYKPNNPIVEVYIPSSVEFMDNDAFRDNEIKKVTFNEGLKRLNDSIFYNNKIQELHLPNTLEFIGIYTFRNNPIKKVYLPDSLKVIDRDAFYLGPLEEVSINKNTKRQWNSFPPNTRIINR